MQIFLGQTRSNTLIDYLNSYGLGEMCNRGEAPPRRFPFAQDNGAFKDWRQKKVFNRRRFEEDVALLQKMKLTPEFVVLPDLVGGGLISLQFSLNWVPKLQGYAPLYLAVQDGMTFEDVLPHIPLIDGIFMGGTMQWKLHNGAKWCAWTHQQGKKYHIGRAGTVKKIRWARRMGADSIDSCAPLWSRERLDEFLAAAFGPMPDDFFD